MGREIGRKKVPDYRRQREWLDELVYASWFTFHSSYEFVYANGTRRTDYNTSFTVYTISACIEMGEYGIKGCREGKRWVDAATYIRFQSVNNRQGELTFVCVHSCYDTHTYTHIQTDRERQTRVLLLRATILPHVKYFTSVCSVALYYLKWKKKKKEKKY